jgi:hypothetical protein
MNNRALFVRRLLAGIAGVGSGLSLLTGLSSNERAPGMIPVVALALAALAIHLPRLGPQLAARAAWWSSFGLGVLLCLIGKPPARMPGVILVLSCGAALLLIGRKELGAAGEQGGYAPTAFRSTLLLLMVLALADAQTFLLVGLIVLQEPSAEHTRSIVLIVASAVYFVGFLGLYRLAVWGALLNVAISTGLLLVFATGAVRADTSVSGLVAVLTAIHIAAAAPMLFALVTRRQLPQPGPRLRAFGASAVIVAVGLGSVLAALTRR